MIELSGQYLLDIKFNGTSADIDSSNLIELIIEESINHLVPTFRLRLEDPSGVYTHIIPLDNDMNKIQIQIGHSIKSESFNIYDFLVYRRYPTNKFSTSMEYDVSGMLDIPKLFSPTYSRGFNQNISDTIREIGSELQVDEYEISNKLNFQKLLLQGNLSNISFLKNLEQILYGSNGNYGYRIFIKNKDNKTILVCKSLTEFINGAVVHDFVVNDKTGQNKVYPVLEYSNVDNGGVIGKFGSKKQKVSYFDYETSEYKSSEDSAVDMNSLSEYFLIDQNDDEASADFNSTGRSNEYTADFSQINKNRFHSKLMSLNKMWISTFGLNDVNPGELVRVIFPQGAQGSLFSFQYSGYWMIEKVVRLISDTYVVRLLLTRNGVDTDKETTLVKARNFKQ